MILTGPGIIGSVILQSLRIDPFNPEQCNPASYDLTLGDELRVYVKHGAERSREGKVCRSFRDLPEAPYELDTRQNNPSYRARMDDKGFLIGGLRTILMHTRERIHTHRHAWVVDGKSSLGRLGLAIHVTAGYGDPGFDGQVTLEMVALGEPVRVYPGMRIAQVRFIPLVDESLQFVKTAPDYQVAGHYRGKLAEGPVASRSYLQFSEAPATIPAPPPTHCSVCHNPNCAEPNGKH
jgi:dCTP deaminase